VRGKKIGFCIHCNHCIREKKCILDDDMKELIELIRSCDALIFATPVYVGAVSGQMKTVMDRARALFTSDRHAIRGKPGIAIAVGGDRSGGQEIAIQQIHAFYTMNGAIPISGGVFGANLGASFWSKDELDELKKDEDGFNSLKKTLKRFIAHMEEME
jgi:multimeric flavodoxin WrbA